LLHHVQDVFLKKAFLNELGKDMIDKFPAENTASLNFWPVLGLYGILKTTKKHTSVA